jgi:hypothetical protein
MENFSNRCRFGLSPFDFLINAPPAGTYVIPAGAEIMREQTK